jgi:hypothetical protein
VAPQLSDQTPPTAEAAKPHRSRWLRIAIIAGAAAAAGAAIIVYNRQPGRTSPAITGVTVNVGGAVPGPPH